MTGSLRNIVRLGTVNPNGWLPYDSAAYLDDSGIDQTGVSVGAVGKNLVCLGGMWLIADNSGELRLVQTPQGQATCIIATVTPDRDNIGNQLNTGTLTYTNLVIHPPTIPFSSQPPIVWISTWNFWKWVTPFGSLD